MAQNVYDNLWHALRFACFALQVHSLYVAGRAGLTSSNLLVLPVASRQSS